MVDRLTLPVREFFVSSAPVKAQELGLKTGGKVVALVQTITENGAHLQINGKEVLATTQIPLKAGQQLFLEVADVNPTSVTLRVLDTPDSPRFAAAQDETQRLAQNLLRLLSAEAGSSLTAKLAALLGQIPNAPEDVQALFAPFSPLNESRSAMTQDAMTSVFKEFMHTFALTEETAENLTAQIKTYFQQFNDAQTRNATLKTLLSLQTLSDALKEVSAERGVNNALIGTHIHNGLAQLSHASPFFFLIPVVVQNALVPLEIYYYKEKLRRGKTPREKTHIVLLLKLPKIGTLKIHILAIARALSIMISSSLPKLKIFLSENTRTLRESIEQHGFTVETLDVHVEKNPAIPFFLAREIHKQLSLKPVNVQA